MIHRLCNPLLTRGFFLFGARGTGKSTLLRQLLKEKSTLRIDFLNADHLERYQRRPQILAEEVAQKRPPWVIIVEVQLVPEILNVVHALIEERKIKFALSGSSARKLKRGGAHLLAGRALLNHLYPLEDTLIGFKLPAFSHSFRKQLVAAPEFYLFDTGVVRALNRSLKSELREEIYAFGRFFEHFVISECIRLNEYSRQEFRFSYLQTKDGAEIDLVIDRPGQALALVEVKSARLVSEDDINKVTALARDLPGSEAFIFSREPRARKVGQVQILPWQDGSKGPGLYFSHQPRGS